MQPGQDSVGFPSDDKPSEQSSAFSAFQKNFPDYARTHRLDDLRAHEYARLDGQGHIYLDYTGGGLYAMSQLREHMELLGTHVFGNPHSNNPTSLAMTHLVERARSRVLEFFNASLDNYVVIFTPNASGALKLVGESYPFGPDGHYLLTFDNHNSVNGIREFARAKGAQFTYLPVVAPELRIDSSQVGRYLALARPGTNNLFAFPAQSNFSGVQHSLDLIARAHDRGWDVLLDAAAFVPTNPLDVDRWQPDFVSLSFYKMFGYPTGVGCLIARKSTLSKLRRPWYAGGTIKISSVQGDGYYLAEGEAAFEDGTVNYLSLPAVEIGLNHLSLIGLDVIHDRVRCLTGWLIDQLLTLRHGNGRALIRILGPSDLTMRGGTVTFTVYDRSGQAFDDQHIEEMANRLNISLRTGCFCNPGAGEVAHGLTEEEMKRFFSSPEGMLFAELRAAMQDQLNKTISAIRVSVGLVTNFDDVYRLVRFIQGFSDKTVDQVSLVEKSSGHGQRLREST